MFETDADLQRPDWPLLQDGPINLYCQADVFAAAKQTLERLDYRLIETSCRSQERLQGDLSAAFRWKDLFGYEPWTGNLNALDDAFYSPEALGDLVAICLDDFHEMAARDRVQAVGLLDVLTRGSRLQLLRGRRLIALVRTDDAQFHCDPLGGTHAHLNQTEWLSRMRGA